MEQIRAKNSADAFWTLDPFAIVRPGDAWYAEIEQRFAPDKYGLVRPLVRRLAPGPARPEFVQIGVVGHGGSGKTTLVRRAMAELQHLYGYQPVYLDALGHLDQADFTFSDVVLAIITSVVSVLRDAEADLPDREIQQFRVWFAEELVTHEDLRAIEGSIETSAEAKGGVPFFASLMAKVSALVRSENSLRKEIRIKAERDTGQLLTRANALLDAASATLKRSLVVVFDNLEKFNNRDLIDAAILRRADDMRALRANLVLFLHPSDEYAPKTVAASQAFSIVTLPMLPVRERDQGYHLVSPDVFETCRDVLARRLDLKAVFVDPDRCIYEIVRLSGGRLRDLLEVARRACELAEPDPVDMPAIERVARKLTGERAARMRPGDLDRLVEVSRTKRIPNDSDHGYLLLHSMVLHYNGEPWWDLHPLIHLDREVTRRIANVIAS